MQKPSQGDPTNPTTPTPKPQNHDPRTSQQNQPTTPPPKQQPGKLYQHKPDHTNQPAPAETTTTTNDHSNSQPHNRTHRSLNTHHTNVKSCPQQSHQGTTRTPTNPTPTSAKPKTHTTHTPTTNTNPHPPTGNTPSQKAFTGSHATSLVLTDPGPLVDLPANSSLLHSLSRGFLAPPKPATLGQHVDNVSTPPE